MRVLVCGGRDFADCDAMYRALLPHREAMDVMIHGAGRGADTMAGNLALFWGVRVSVFGADWDTHGKAAGPMRNQRMIDDGKPDLVIAFPGGRGTADMVRRARGAGVEVVEVTA